MKVLAIGLAEQDTKKRTRKKVKVSFETVRLIKDYQDKKFTTEQAAEAAGMPTSTFFRYAKMEQEKLYELACQTQYEAMSSKEQAVYDESIEKHKKFAAAMANVRACHKLVLEKREAKKQKFREEYAKHMLEKREAKEQKSREEYAKYMNKRTTVIRFPKKEPLGSPTQIDSILCGSERTCEMCSKIFYIKGTDSYQYKRHIKGKARYCCSWNCYNKMLKHYGVEGRKRAKK